MTPTRFNVRKYGAVGDGYADDTNAIKDATYAALETNGCLYFPAGLYLITKPIGFKDGQSRIAIVGDGANVSLIYAQNCAAFDMEFAQNGAQQPWGATMRDLGIHALGVCAFPVRISYGVPIVTNDHNQPSCSLTNLQIVSDAEGYFQDGVILEGAWNPTLENVFISGNSFGGEWNKLMGAGVNLRGMCVNAHLSNVHCNFWADGLLARSTDARNTEGIFASNCSMVAVKRGVHLIGLPDLPAPRISTLTWTGGLIELRVGGVGLLPDGTVDPAEVSAAFYLEHVWTALINGCQIISEMLPFAPKYSYGVVPKNSAGVVVSACDVNGFSFGVHTAEACKAVAVTGCTFTNVETQVVFAPGTEGSRSYGHVLFNNVAKEIDWPGCNKMGFVD